METKHKDTAVEKAIAFVKDMFGAPGARVPDVTITSVQPASEEEMRVDSDAFTTKSVAQLNAEIVRRHDGV
jgi:hypothetical protein